MEKLAKGDLPGIYHAIAWEAFESEGIRLDQVHVDTSLSFEGADERSALEDSVLRIDYGHNKERRPDLKQFKFGLVSVEGPSAPRPSSTGYDGGPHVRPTELGTDFTAVHSLSLLTLDRDVQPLLHCLALIVAVRRRYAETRP